MDLKQTIQVLVVDDEPLARARIVNLLRQESPKITWAECKNGNEAIKAIKSTNPDIVFLDIQMPDKTGFDVLKSFTGNELPIIIFVTAYDQYAIKAFDVCAVDYLLKPFDDPRFKQAFEKARNELNSRKLLKFNTKLNHLIDFYFNEDQEHVFEIKHEGWLHKISHRDISHIESLGNYVKIHSKNKMYIDRTSMVAMERKLENTSFFRVHRSFLINKDFIERVSYKGNNEYRIRLNTGAKLVSGRAYKENVVNYLEMKESQQL